MFRKEGESSRITKTDREHLVEYFIRKYSSSGPNIGPLEIDIPQSEVEDYHLVFNGDGTIKSDYDRSPEKYAINKENSDKEIDELLERLRDRESSTLYGPIIMPVSNIV